jgi:uncharacterized caspase-like protein
MIMVAIKMNARLRLLAALLLFLLTCPASAQQGQEAQRAQQAQEKRIALVIGDGAYRDAGLPTTANDAGLIAEQLQAAGFDVSGARDLDGDMLRQAFRDFVDKARQAGPDSVAMVYFAGYGLQLEGENYLVPVDAQIPTAADIPIQAVRVSDLTRALAELPMKARIVVLDAARENPFAKEGPPLASGLALVAPDPGLLVAFNAAPGTVAPPEKAGDAYGAYAQALAEMIREGGVSLTDVFDSVRLRVSDATKGAVVPWDADRVEAKFIFFERTAEAPPPDAGLSSLQDKPLKNMGADEAYQAAIERDTVSAYQEFLAAYPDSPEARRVRAILAARREELIWRRTLEVGTAEAYWSYLHRYPSGPHAADCRRRLVQLNAALEPPQEFAPIAYDLPPPPPDEIEIVDQPVLTFADLDFPPPPPVAALPPPPAYIVDLPPPPPVEEFVLPAPDYAPLPVWVDRPVYVAPPPVNIIAYNIHNTVIVNQNAVVVKDPVGKPVPPLANAVAAGRLPPGTTLPEVNALERGRPQPERRAGEPNMLPALAALHPALPPSVAARAQQPNRLMSPPRAGVGPTGVVPPGLTGHALPGQPSAPPLPGVAAHAPPNTSERAVQQQQLREQQIEQQRAEQEQQQRALQEQQQRALQAEQQRTLQEQQQRVQQEQQQRVQQGEQQRALQAEQQRALQAEQQRRVLQLQQQQQREQQLQQQQQRRQQQMQREQQIQQQRAQQAAQQRAAIQAQQAAQQRAAIQAQQAAQQRAAFQAQQAAQQRAAIQAQQAAQQRAAIQAQQAAQQHAAIQAQQAAQQRAAIQAQQAAQQRAHQATQACGRPGAPPCR